MGDCRGDRRSDQWSRCRSGLALPALGSICGFRSFSGTRVMLPLLHVAPYLCFSRIIRWNWRRCRSFHGSRNRRISGGSSRSPCRSSREFHRSVRASEPIQRQTRQRKLARHSDLYWISALQERQVTVWLGFHACPNKLVPVPDFRLSRKGVPLKQHHAATCAILL